MDPRRNGFDAAKHEVGVGGDVREGLGRDSGDLVVEVGVIGLDIRRQVQRTPNIGGPIDRLFVHPVPLEPDVSFVDLLAEGNRISLKIPFVVGDANRIPEFKTICDKEVGNPLVFLTGTPNGIEMHPFESGPTVCGLPLRTFAGFRFWHDV